MTLPSYAGDLRSPPRAILAVVVLAAIAAAAWALGQQPGATGSRQSFALLSGAAFGIVLQRGRFCFLCNLRDLLRDGDPRGAIAILVALAAGAVGYAAVFGAWLPNPFGGRLPPTAHIGPVGPALALAAFVFGAGMAISGSCLSAHLYRLGEGSPTSPFALLGAVGGFILGFITWNPIYLALTVETPAVWLPAHLGYPGALAATLATLGGLAWLALAHAAKSLRKRIGAFPPSPLRGGAGGGGGPERNAPATALHDEPPRHIRSHPHPYPPRKGEGGGDVERNVARAVLVERWPPVATGLLVGAIATLAYLRVAPLGVTAEIGSAARTAASAASLLPDTLFGLDRLRGCATVVKETLLSENGLFVLGLMAASFAAALVSGRFQPTAPTGGQVVRGLAGGLLMGWGAMTALGCTVGVLLSGVHAGALSGWVFLVFVILGVVATDALGRRLSSRAVA